jgi:hypothetical protein
MSQQIQTAKSRLHRKVDIVVDRLYINNKYAARIEAIPMPDQMNYHCFHFHTATGVYVINVERSDEAAAQQTAIHKFVSESQIYRYGCNEADPYTA